ncbi:putative disease resistance protein RGA3 [Papaver somniferum]|uniref:putative disease resistance protein RGA3 n=1 Tax=Papaver somniferum TaxID=3469 RepID=UPI000E6F6CC9|nr:putative disease resistance protein RGA3 [Papaver somniferum]
MAQDILVSGASGALKKLVSVVASEISGAWGVKDELKKFQETLELIAAKTSDAEAMRRSEKNSKVKDFFSSSNQVAFRFKMAHKIKDVNKRFNQISSDMKKSGFESTSLYDDQTAEIRNNRLTASFFGEDLKVVGRENDKSEIIKLLNSSAVNSNQEEKVSVISLVGMGGLGKTTLAQSVYSSVENHFRKRLWVCVSDEFDIYKILIDIMESITNSKCPTFSNINVLVDQVKKELENELYLLVLDDVWTEDFMEWNKLKSYLDVRAAASKIIVTTRKQEVASVVQGVIPPYNLDVLSEADCWSIIKKKAFSPGGASETPNMINIGKQIAKSCGGLPLAATFLGGLRRSQNDEMHWLSIRDNTSLDTPENQSGGIIPILKLSYDNLPSHLKQCFSYCCLFPKDWVIDREILIQLWMAEGFLHPPNGGCQNSVENVGNHYFLDLLSNSFFQDVKKNVLGDIQTFKMHDLAQSVAGSHEVTVLNASEMQNDASKSRRLQLIMEDDVLKPVSNALTNAKTLRTVFYRSGWLSYWSPLRNRKSSSSSSLKVNVSNPKSSSDIKDKESLKRKTSHNKGDSDCEMGGGK